MISQINDITQIWWQWMSSMFWQVSLLIIIVTALDMSIRRWAWPQVRYALWGLVFIKLIIPPTWQMPTSIISRVQPQVEERISIQIGAIDWSERDLLVPVSSELIQDNIKEPVIIEETETKVTWQTLALFGWIAGMVTFALLLIRKMFQFRKRNQIHDNGKIPEWFHELIQDTADRLNLKRVPSIIFSEDTKSPAVYGLFKPVLLLPEGYLDQLSQEQAEHVLIHELCHLKRGDLLIHWFCIVLQIVYWFNPLLIWTRRQMRNVCEICCDLSVANILKEKTTKYRDTLLRTAHELFLENMEPSLGFLGIFEEPFRLVPRLKWLEKKTWKNHKLKILITICISLFMFACVMPMSKSSKFGTENNNHMVESDSNPIIVEEEPGEQKEQQGITDEVDEERELKAKKKELEPTVITVVIPMVHADAKEIVPHIPLTDRGGSFIDDRTNTIIISDIASNIAEAKKIVKQLDRPVKMVFYEILVMEVDANKKIDFGSRSYDLLYSNAEQNSSIEEDKYEPLVKRLESELNGKIISSPQILTVNGKTAELQFGEAGAYLNLKITPQKIGDNTIQQEISLEDKRIDESLDNGQIKKSLNTSIIVKEGNTFVIGGMQSNRNDSKSEDARELCIFITPKIFEQEESQVSYNAIEKEQVRRFPEPESKGPDEESSISTFMAQASRHLKLKQTNGYIADLKTRIDEIKKKILQYEEKVEGTPKREQELVSLNREYESLNGIYNSLLNRKHEAELAISMEKKQAEGISTEKDKKLGTLTFINDELNAAEKRLKEKEEEIRDYREKHMSGLPEQLQTNLTILNKLQKDTESLTNGLRDLEIKRSALLKEIASSTGPKSTDEILAYSKKQLSLLESKYSSMHPDVIRLTDIIAGLEATE